MQFNFHATSSAKQLLREMGQVFGVPLKTTDDVHRVTIPHKYGRGNIRGMDFRDGLSLYFIDIKFNSAVTFRWFVNDCAPVRLTYCITGEMAYYSDLEARVHTAESQEVLILADRKSQPYEWRFPNTKVVQLTIVMLDRKSYFAKIKHLLSTVPPLIQELFEDVDCKQSFIHKQRYGISIAETLRELEQPAYTGLASQVYLESKTLELLYKQIEQLKNGEQEGANVKLYKGDLEMVRSAKDVLVSDLRKSPTIKELSVKVGISPTKLKKDFKLVYGKTINNYLRDERMAYAAFLLSEDNISIREVAYAVGYTNQSHFARRFKEVYGVLPKDYHGVM